jgi:hypothetical protein
MYTVENSNGQLKLSYSNLIEFYQFPTFKSVSFAFDTVRGNYYVSINFISNDKNNSLRLYLVDISNQGTWTDNVTGANNAVGAISSWISSSIIPSGAGASIKSNLLRVSSTTGTIIDKVRSISFANVGTANATVSADAGVTFITLKAGESISFDAGGINNFFAASNFRHNTTTAGAELLIVYTY